MERLERVQYLRGVAALVVLFSHLLLSMREFAEKGDIGFPGWSLSGSFGVDIFFVISGFIMVFTAGRDFGRPEAAGQFLRRRLIRIVPLYWMLTLVMTAILVVSQWGEADQVTAGEVLGSLSFIPYEWEGKFRPVLGVGWSLSYEMLFYALFAIALPFRRGMLVLTAMLAGLVMLGLFNPSPAPLMAWTRPILIEFAIGAWIGVLYQRGVRLSVPWPMAWVVGLLVLQELLPRSGGGIEGWNWVDWAIAATIVALGALSPPPARPSRFLSLLGDSSYSLYLSHPIVLTVFAVIWLRLAPIAGWSVVALGLIGCVLCVTTGWLLYERFERPLTAVLKTWLARPRPAVAT